MMIADNEWLPTQSEDAPDRALTWFKSDHDHSHLRSRRPPADLPHLPPTLPLNTSVPLSQQCPVIGVATTMKPRTTTARGQFATYCLDSTSICSALHWFCAGLWRSASILHRIAAFRIGSAPSRSVPHRLCTELQRSASNAAGNHLPPYRVGL